MSVVQQLQFVIKPLAAFRPAILVSKPHPISNIRFIKLAAGDKVDEEWIENRQKVIQRHHLFWKQNNLDFMEAKQLFYDKHVGKPSPEQISYFYREFASNSYVKMAQYNRELWKESFSMLIPGLKYETKIISKWMAHVSKRIQDKIKVFFSLWFVAGLAFPLIVEQ